MANTENISLRASTEVKLMIEQAAALSATSVNAFILEHAYGAAVQLLNDHRRIMLNQAEAALFLAALENPPQLNESMTKLLELGDHLVSG